VGLFHIVDGSTPRPVRDRVTQRVLLSLDPEVEGDEEDMEAWEMRNYQASSILWNSLAPSQQTGVESVVGSAADMWSALLTTYYRTTMVEKAYLFLDFLNFKWKPGQTMRQFTTEYQGLVSRLHAAGMKVEDFMIPLRLMLALKGSEQRKT